MKVSDGELGARDMHGEVGLTTARQVLDVTVPAVFGAAGDRAGAFSTDFSFKIASGGSGMDVFGLGEVGDDAVEGVAFDELGLTAGPFGEDLGRGCAAHDPGVD